MSFTDEYLALQKKKKKEEQKTTGHSFTDKYLSEQTEKTVEDIAPVFVNKTAALYGVEREIAPTKKTEEKDERKWFEKGLFEDGYQIGDVFKTIRGTSADLRENIAAGILGIGEKAVDAGAYLVGGAAGLLGADEFKDKTADFIKKDLYNEENIAQKIVLGKNKNSVLGEKTDALAQSGGQLLGTIGLQMAGVPWFVTSGVTGFGSEAENALNEGASYGKAGLSAAVSAGAEILTEKLFGGSGLGETGMIAVDKLTKGISNKVVKVLADYGVDVLAEGSEEVFSQIASNLGSALYKEEKLGEILFSEEAIDEYIESFLGGGVLGGVMNASNAVSSIRTGRDYRSGLNANEQKVVDKVVNDRIAEQGGKLTDKEKAAIEEAVIRDMDRGYIDTDTIEEVLGGESYQTYKQTVDSEDALLKEYEELGKKQNATLAEQTRYNELHQQVNELKANSKRTLHKAMLSDSVYDMVQKDRLFESYKEDARRGQAFEADLTKYDTKQQETIKKAVESGILNNTNRTHEFVDMIAKITADKGVLFDFTNNERLKESGFAIDGKAVNGYVTKDGVTLNIDSHKSLNSVVGHEITHVLEGTEFYDTLKQVVTEYAKTKGDYQGRYDTLAKLYEGVKDADVDAELTADLVGDYLFTDEDFVRNLSVQHRNVFQKIYDEIKYLCKVATAGSKEARELEKVKRAFEKAYQESGKSESTKYSLSDSDGKQLTKEQQEYFKDSKVRDENGNLKVMYHGTERGGFHTFESQYSDDDTSLFFVDSPAVAASYSGSNEVYTARTFNTTKDINRFLAEIGYEDYEVVRTNGKYTLYYDVDDEIATSDSLKEIYEEFCNFAGVGEGEVNYKVYLNLKNPLVVDAKGKNWNALPGLEDSAKYDYIKVVEVGDAPGEVTIEYAMNGETVTETIDLYEKFPDGLATALSDMAPGESVEDIYANPATTREYAQYAKENGYDGVIFKNIYDIGAYGGRGATEATVAIAFDSNQIKSVANEKPTADKDIRYSLSEDSKGRELSKEQQAFFKDSKIRVSEVDGWKNTITENGALLPVYHGTNSGEFYEFDKGSIGSANDYGWFGRGFYFAFTEGEASYYGKRVLECYLDVKRPFIYADEMETFDGRDGGDTNFDFAAFIINMSDKFPDIAKNTFVKVVEWGTDEAIRKPFTDFAQEIKELYDSDRLKVVEIDDGGKMIYQYAFTSDVDSIDASARIKKIIKEKHIDGSWMANWYREKGEITETDYDEILDLFEEYGYDQFGDTWLHTRYNSKEQAEKSRLSAAVQYISEKKYSYVDQHMPHYYMDSNVSREFSEELRKRGYDGIIQSRYGDEVVVFDSNQIKLTSNKNPTTNPDIRYSLSDSDGKPIDTARISQDEFDTRYSLSHNDEIAKGQSNYLLNHKAYVTDDELKEAQRVTNAMVDVMMKYSSILPEDKIGKVLTKNGSYDRSVENTTICVRTLAYNEFVDKVQEEIGRPLTQMESFLVSQKLYDIATDPQCLYCYVSLDRKAFNDMLLRYMQDRDTVIAKYNNSDKSPESVSALYTEFLNGRKDTKPMKDRFNKWLDYVDSGTQLLSLADIATEDRQSVIKAKGGNLAAQLADARAYAQSASWSKIQKDYVAYRDEILKLGDRVVQNLNEHYGLRWYSFSDYSAAFIVENMQQITDASIRGLKGLAYTKDTDFVEIFAPSGMNINVSVFVNIDENGNFFIDEKQSADFRKALELRERYPNVGIVATVTNDEALRWAASQEWSDVIIPFHIVRTGTDVAEYYKWLNYTAESADTIKDADIWNSYLDSLNLKSDGARKKVSKNIYPNEHKNDKDTYLNLCESRGLTPRFVRFAGEDWYMKLVNETRLSADASSPLKPVYNEDAAKASFQKFVEKGGYEGGWYKKAINVDAEAKAVAADVLAGKKANEVDYGRQDNFAPEALLAGRKANRKHGQYSLSAIGEQFAPVGKYNVYGKDMKLVDFSNPEADFNAESNTESNTENRVGDMFPDDLAPIADDPERFDSLTDADAPAEVYAEDGVMGSPMTMPKSVVDMIAQNVRASLGLTNQQMADVHRLIEEYGKQEFPSREQLFEEVRDKFGTYTEKTPDTDVQEIKKAVRKYRMQVSDTIKGDIADYNDFRRRNFGKILFSREGVPVDVVYDELAVLFPGYFPREIINPTDQLEHIAEVVNFDSTISESFDVPEETLWNVTDDIIEQISDYQYGVMKKTSHRDAKAAADYLAKHADEYAAEDIAPAAEKTATERVKGTAQTTQAEVSEKIKNIQTELENNIRLREQSNADFDQEIARLQAEYNAKKNKNSIAANDILRRIERTQRMKDNVDNDYAKRISNLEERIEKMNTPAYQTAAQRQAKQQEYVTQMENLVGDTTDWVDKKLGISYKINTLKRNLRDVIRKADGSRDIKKADAIYDELQGKYNHNEASLNREAAQIKKPYANQKITKAEDAYIQMLGELRHNPDTKLTTDTVNRFYEQHKNSIDKAKVDKVIADARKTYDSLLLRVNEVLKEQGMKEIPYRKGYFPHFTEDKQSFLAKLFNWKTRKDEIPTDIAGLTEQFNPNRSWQSFNKERKGDTTDYSFTKGLDTYVQGALDWIYHIEDIQKRRAFENHIRYVHSEKGVQDKIDAIRKNEEYDADEVQAQIDLIYREAANPLNNFVTDLRAGTNRLANKKSSMDRGMEEATNRHFYSTMTNISNRVTANMVGGSISSALTNFIPITQSWGEVSPVSSLRAMGDTIASAFRDDGMIDKSDFLTNRIRKADNLYKSGWDKVSDKVSLLMESIDSFTAQTVWRSKYLENISNGMSENEAIKSADQFAEGVIGGRSRGNMPTIFESKNPLIKTLTAFQLEVNNQYGYMLKDMPQDMQNESRAKLVKGYAAMFIGAYAYNALYSSLTGRDAAFDPIGIVEDLLRDLGLLGDDEEEEPVDVLMNLTDSLLEEAPFVGGLVGGGRIPISSALPYDGVYEALSGTMTDIAEKDWSNLTNEWLNPLYYLALPVGGGQIRKAIQGLSMFSDDHPIAGSYTASGNLRFPVDDTLGSRIKAGIFGQYASKNAREYFDNGYAPLKEKQIQEFIDLDIPIRDYWEYREGLSGLNKLSEKADYIADLDLPIDKKNLLINNIADREEDIDLTGYEDFDNFDEFDFAVNNPEKYEIAEKVGGYEAYMKYQEAMKGMKLEEKADYVAGLNLTTAQKNALINGETDRKEPIDLTGYENYSSLEEMDYAKKNPENYAVAKAVGGYDAYRSYSGELYDIKADKDSSGKSISGSRKEKVIEYINGLDIEAGEKYILFKSEYNADDTYNYEIIDYLNSREDISYDETVTILKKLGFTVDSQGNIYW